MSSRYFQNKECEFFPCHETDELNCLFCFCPLYPYADCGGNPTWIHDLKDCSFCTLPHEDYDYVINKLEQKRTQLLLATND